MRKDPILIADDDPNDVMLIQLAFRKADIPNPVIVAKTGLEAVDLLRGFPRCGSEFPAVILLDLHMPCMDGLEVLAWIDAHPELRSVPVAMLSSSRTPSEAAAAVKLGARAYYVKPVKHTEMIDIAKEISRKFLAG